jgi:hypothetical protein
MSQDYTTASIPVFQQAQEPAWRQVELQSVLGRVPLEELEQALAQSPEWQRQGPAYVRQLQHSVSLVATVGQGACTVARGTAGQWVDSELAAEVGKAQRAALVATAEEANAAVAALVTDVIRLAVPRVAAEIGAAVKCTSVDEFPTLSRIHAELEVSLEAY